MRISDWSSDVCSSDLALSQILNPASHRAIRMRVLRTLHGVYSDGEDWERATRSADRLLKLSPNDPDALRDRGLGYLHMGHASGARTDLARYLQLNPNARDAMKVRARLVELGGAGRVS